MARLARVVIEQLPHVVVQQASGRTAFDDDADFAAYLALLAEHVAAGELTVLAWALMPTQVMVVAVPRARHSLRLALGETHRRYARRVNAEERTGGSLWRGRFSSYPVDDLLLREAVAFVEGEPVAAGLAEAPAMWRWSSAAMRAAGNDPLGCPEHWSGEPVELTPDRRHLFRAHSRTGRPLGSAGFIRALEESLGRQLAPRKRGRRPKPAVVEAPQPVEAVAAAAQVRELEDA